ncbi:MAG: hypothetical protein IPN53_10870 [Comamonadaceae bacterium]|nr:hypothetical protein [Comamonadaceae bacterium]
MPPAATHAESARESPASPGFPNCSGQMRIIACIIHSADIRQILDHIGVDLQPPHTAPGTLATIVG